MRLPGWGCRESVKLLDCLNSRWPADDAQALGIGKKRKMDH